MYNSISPPPALKKPSGDDIANGGAHVPMLKLSPKAKADFQSNTFHQHQSTSRLTLGSLGVQNLAGIAAIAPEMGEFFK